MLWKRDAFLDHLCFVHSEHEMVAELFGPLHGTEEIWREQGASEAEINLTAFAWDRVDVVHAPFNRGPLNDLVETVISETETERVVRDKLGRTTVLPKDVATISLPQNFPLEEACEWDRIKSWFRTDEDRVDTSALEACRKQRDAGGVVRFYILGAYDFLRQLLGDEMACMELLEDRESVQQILSDIGDMQVAALETVAAALPIDILCVHEDFAGKSGPLVGPELIRDVFNPYYRRMWELAQKAGARLFDLDSDGYIDPVIDALLDGGINCLHPIEPTGGTDLVQIRKRYGNRLTLRGGIDKFALCRGKSAIDAELDHRLDPCLRGGGTMFALDHRIPREVTIDAYRYYVTELRRRLKLPPIDASEPGWCRMA